MFLPFVSNILPVIEFLTRAMKKKVKTVYILTKLFYNLVVLMLKTRDLLFVTDKHARLSSL